MKKIKIRANLKNVNKESLIETVETLSDPETMKDITRALKNYKKGKFISLEQLEKELKCFKRE